MDAKLKSEETISMKMNLMKEGRKMERCSKCYHPRDGIVHKVYSSCARFKHKNYSLNNNLHNYLNKMSLNEYNKQIWFDDYKYFHKNDMSGMIELYDKMLLESEIFLEVSNDNKCRKTELT